MRNKREREQSLRCLQNQSNKRTSLWCHLCINECLVRPKPSPKPESSDGDGKKSPATVGAKNAALQSKLFGSGAVPLPGVAPVQLRRSVEEEGQCEVSSWFPQSGMKQDSQALTH